MNKHVKIQASRPSLDLSRARSWSAPPPPASRSAIPACPALAADWRRRVHFDPSVWYSIAPDGIVTVTCGKADMGQHIASTMAQIIAEELGASWKDMRVQLAPTIRSSTTPCSARRSPAAAGAR